MKIPLRLGSSGGPPECIILPVYIYWINPGRPSHTQEDYIKNNLQKIYTTMSHMSPNEEIPQRYFVDSSQLTNGVLDSGATCHMVPEN